MAGKKRTSKKPTRVRRNATCPACGAAGAYHGLRDIECPRPKCAYYKKPATTAPRPYFWIEDLGDDGVVLYDRVSDAPESAVLDEYQDFDVFLDGDSTALGSVSDFIRANSGPDVIVLESDIIEAVLSLKPGETYDSGPQGSFASWTVTRAD